MTISLPILIILLGLIYTTNLLEPDLVGARFSYKKLTIPEKT